VRDGLDDQLVSLVAYLADDEPGVVVAVTRGGAVEAAAARGAARLEAGVPLTVTTPSDVASVSKQLGAAVVVSLAHEGLLALDDDVRRHVPEVGVADVTLRHCLQHTSGLPDYLTLAALVGESPKAACGLRTFLDRLPGLTTPELQPGARISYSNTGYVVAAIASERAAGRPWPDLLAERVLEPLGMAASAAKTHAGQELPGMAFGYSRGADGRFARDELHVGPDAADRLPPGTRHTIGDGEVMTTASDLARWHAFLLDGRTLGTPVRQELLAPAVLADGRATSYGMGLWWEQREGVRAVGHSGSVWGFRAYSVVDVETGWGVAVLANRADLDAGDLAWRALATARDGGRLFGSWVSTAPPRRVEVTPRADSGIDLVEAGEAAVATAAGPGRWQGCGSVRSVTLEADTLVVEDRLGERLPLRRGLPGAAPPPTLGAYAGTTPPTRAVLAEADGALTLRLGAGAPVPLVHVARTDAGELLAGGELVVLAGPGPELTVSMADTSVRLVRVEDGAGQGEGRSST
jgi:CubicO group peptidase (beta-lactamase class C family)